MNDRLRAGNLAAVLATVVLAMLALPGLAAATPGSAEDQYAENAPGPGGGHPSKEIDRGNGTDPLGPVASEKLAALGEPGEKVHELVGSTSERTGNSHSPELDRTRDGGLAINGIGDAMLDDSGNGMGLVLPLVLLLVVVVLAASVYLNRRGKSRSGRA